MLLSEARTPRLFYLENLQAEVPPEGQIILYSRPGIGLTWRDSEGIDHSVASREELAEEYLPLALFQAKGDLLAGRGEKQAERLPLGPDGYILTACSSEYLGVAWEPVPSPFLNGDVSGYFAQTLVGGLEGYLLPQPSAGFLTWADEGWTFVEAGELPLAGDLEGTLSDSTVVGLYGYLIELDGSGALRWDASQEAWVTGYLPAGGDLSGYLEDAQVQGLQGRPIEGEPLDGQVLAYSAVQDAWVPITIEGGGGTFLDLADTPNSYAGYAGYLVQVASSEDQLIFAAAGGGNGGSSPAALEVQVTTPDSFNPGDPVFLWGNQARRWSAWLNMSSIDSTMGGCRLNSLQGIVCLVRSSALEANLLTWSTDRWTLSSAAAGSSVNSTYPVTACRCSDSVFAVSYLGASFYPYGVVGQVSGTSITLGTPVSAESASSANFHLVCSLTSSKIALAYANGTTDARAKVGTISGTSLSWGSANIFYSGSAEMGSICALSPSLVVVYYRKTSDRYPVAKAGTVSGSTITWGAETSVYAFTSYSVPVLATSQGVTFLAYTGTTLYAKSATVSGTTFTFGNTLIISLPGTVSHVRAVAYNDYIYVLLRALPGVWYLITFSVAGTSTSLAGQYLILETFGSTGTVVFDLLSSEFGFAWWKDSVQTINPFRVDGPKIFFPVFLGLAASQSDSTLNVAVAGKISGLSGLSAGSTYGPVSNDPTLQQSGTIVAVALSDSELVLVPTKVQAILR
jgi:hypothetical protein